MGTVVGPWRLKLMIVLIMTATGLYLANAMFYDLGGTIDESGYLNYSGDNPSIIDYNDTAEGTEMSGSFVDVVFGIGSFLTFGNIDNPWARFILLTTTSLIFVAIGYIIFTFVKEWIPFV